MHLTFETKMGLAILFFLCLVSFALGRYTTPVKTVTKTQVVEKEVERKSIVENEKKTDRSTVTKVDITNKDGTRTVTTRIDYNKSTRVESQIHDNTNKEVSSRTDSTTIKGGSSVFLSALIAFPNSFTPMYGASVSKSVLGPITVGAFGLTNGTFGASLGLVL